jgi:phage-related baseplate assembly protein
MSDILNEIDNLPDISFIDGLTLEDIQSQMLSDFVEKYQEITGKKIQLSKSDPNRIIMLGCAQIIYQGLQNIDKGGKMNFLKYAYDGYLENMGALKKVTRNPARPAKVPVKFTLSGKREAATSIPRGTRVTAAYEVYFATVEYAEIPPGETEATVMAECTEAGSIGNDFAAGELTTLVDPIGFVSKVWNTQKSAGGTEVESDQNMAERIYLAPSSYSTAGPDDAYEYWVKDSNPDIGDVKITSPSPGVVDIRFVMSDGSVPDDAAILAVEAAVNQRGKRPLTDNVQVMKPEVEEYGIDVTYYINSSDSHAATAIQEQAEAAVESYKLWQASKVGRDINPDELIARLNDAGAKRAEVRSPSFRVIGETAKAQCAGVNIVYGGLEND